MKGLLIFILFIACLLGIVIPWATFLYRTAPVSKDCQTSVRALGHPALKIITIAWDYRLTTEGGVLAWPRTIFSLPAATIYYPTVYDCAVGENGTITYPFIKK